MQKSEEFSVGQTITQDISDPLPHLYVYRTPELAVANEIAYTSKEITTSLYQKTVVKLMCWGPVIETPKKFAFANMCVLEDIGYPKKSASLQVTQNTSSKRSSKWPSRKSSRGSSRVREIKQLSPKRVASPKIIRDNFTMRLYASAFHGKKSPTNNAPSKPTVKKTNIQQLLIRMKKDTERLDQEIRDIEKWNHFSKLEEIDSNASLETFLNQ